MYSKVSFIKISNNRNPAKDFYIDITTMKDARLRMSSLKSQYNKYLDSLETDTPLPDREVFRYFTLDYSFYTLEKGCFDTYNDAKERRLDLYDEQYEKMNWTFLYGNIPNKYLLSKNEK